MQATVQLCANKGDLKSSNQARSMKQDNQRCRSTAKRGLGCRRTCPWRLCSSCHALGDQPLARDRRHPLTRRTAGSRAFPPPAPWPPHAPRPLRLRQSSHVSCRIRRRVDSSHSLSQSSLSTIEICVPSASTYLRAPPTHSVISSHLLGRLLHTAVLTSSPNAPAPQTCASPSPQTRPAPSRPPHSSPSPPRQTAA